MTEWFAPSALLTDTSDPTKKEKRSRNRCSETENEDAAMNLGKELKVRAASCSILLGLFISASTLAMAQSEPAAPPPPPGPGMGGMMLGMHGPEGGVFFHEETVGEEHKVITGAPMTAVVEVTHDSTLQDGNTIHTQNQSTVYRDSEGRVRREVPFKFMTPTTGSTKGTMIIITDPVAGTRYILNPQNKTAHQMPLRPPMPRAAAEGEPLARRSDANLTTADLGSKTILGLQATGTRVTRTVPAGVIGNAKPIEVVTERWMSTDLQIPLSTTHTDPMMGTMSSQVSSVTRGEPSASLFQVPSDYKVVTGKAGDMMYMAHP